MRDAETTTRWSDAEFHPDQQMTGAQRRRPSPPRSAVSGQPSAISAQQSAIGPSPLLIGTAVAGPHIERGAVGGFRAWDVPAQTRRGDDRAVAVHRPSLGRATVAVPQLDFGAGGGGTLVHVEALGGAHGAQLAVGGGQAGGKFQRDRPAVCLSTFGQAVTSAVLDGPTPSSFRQSTPGSSAQELVEACAPGLLWSMFSMSLQLKLLARRVSRAVVNR